MAYQESRRLREYGFLYPSGSLDLISHNLGSAQSIIRLNTFISATHYRLRRIRPLFVRRPFLPYSILSPSKLSMIPIHRAGDNDDGSGGGGGDGGEGLIFVAEKSRPGPSFLPFLCSRARAQSRRAAV